jgi:hypothetical protein
MCLQTHVSDLYIPGIGPHIFLQQNRQTDRGNIKVAHRHVNVELGLRGRTIPFLGIFVSNFRYCVFAAYTVMKSNICTTQKGYLNVANLTFLVMKHDAVYADPVGGAGLQLQRDIVYIRFKPVFQCRAAVRHFDDSHHVGGGPEVLRCNIFKKTELANATKAVLGRLDPRIFHVVIISVPSSVP